MRDAGNLWHKAFSIVMELMLSPEKKQIITYEPLYEQVKDILQSMNERVSFPKPEILCRCGHDEVFHKDLIGCVYMVHSSIAFHGERMCGCREYREKPSLEERRGDPPTKGTRGFP